MYTFIDGVQFYDKDEVDDLFAQNGSTGLSDRLYQEVIDRAAADDALGVRIDQEAGRLTQESNMRLLGDQTLTNQLTAIEQLWSTLISANFIDTDSNAIVVDDSGKSVRQIAHDEFYRQLVTDADDVKHQLDTLKELADYLQNNPTILTDIYTKLGLTWSLDTPTDFGTFDFSRVLTATDVDSAIVELHNTLVSKVGDLTQLTTTFKGNLVGAINEVKALAVAGGGGGGGGSGGADTTQLEAKLNAEIAARTHGDTDLGNRITASVGTLASLTTTAKDNLVAAVNEVQSEVNTTTSTANTANSTANTAKSTADTNKTAIGTLSSLTTTAKTNLVAAVNELQTEVNTATSTANTAKSTADTNKTAIGTLSSLTTTAKTNLVAAVNEVQSEVNTAKSTADTAKSTADTAKSTADTAKSTADTAKSTANTNKTAIGTLSSLTTTAKTNLVAAVNELQTEVNTKLARYSTTMLSGGFVSSSGGYISLRDFWNKLVERYGPSAEVHFVWSVDKSGFVSLDGTANTTSVYIDGCTVIYDSRGRPNEPWTAFHALVLNRDYTPYIMSADVTDSTTTLSTNKIYRLASVSDVRAAGNTYRYTYVVDSDAKLTAWANNDKSSGQDYTSVLIRKGTWTSSKGVNLTAAGTKVVVGEPGSKLVFTVRNNYSLYYLGNRPSDGYMQGVTLQCESGAGLFNCVNLTNCVVSAASYGFAGCTNLTSCSAIVTTTTNNSPSHGFIDCTNLTSCYGSGTGTGNNGYGYGFVRCDNISHCTGTGTGTTGYGFSGCTNLTSCSGYGSGTGSNGYGFGDCTNLTSCSGSGTGTTGYGFANCQCVILSKAGSRCTSAVFNSCYASNAKNSTYACADTANGGFNNTTNPSEG